MLANITSLLSNQHNVNDRVGLGVACLMTILALYGPFGPPAFAQGRPSTLTPNRDSAPPGATLSIAINPALATQQPAGSRLLLRSAQGRRGPGDVELRIAQWRGDAIRATIPRDASIDAGAARLVLLDRRNEVIAQSGNQMFRVAAAGEVPSAGRAAGSAGSAAHIPGNGSTSRVPGSPGPDVAGRRQLDRSGSAVVPSVPGVVPDADPRTERGVHARSGSVSTPGVSGQAREMEIDSHGSANRRQAPFLRDQTLSGMDYRRLAVRSVAECHTACSIESQCRSWTYRPAQRNNTFDNGDDGATCFLKSGIPQREYARGYVSGIKPPPPAVAAGAPPPPVVSR